jgi:hypothetical protein
MKFYFYFGNKIVCVQNYYFSVPAIQDARNTEFRGRPLQPSEMGRASRVRNPDRWKRICPCKVILYALLHDFNNKCLIPVNVTFL